MKIRSSTLAIVIMVIFVMSVLGGCAKKECEIPADCGTNNKCVSYACTPKNTCVKNVKPDCCGNAKCEPNTGENSCTCADCKPACDTLGKVKYNVTSTRGVKSLESKYAMFVCEADECVIGVSSDDVTELKLTSVYEERTYFKLDILSTLNNPFNLKNDVLEMRITLSDLNQQKISGALVVTGVQVLNGNYLMGEKVLNQEMSQVGQSFTEQLQISSAQKVPEEEATISLKISYNYIPIDSRGDLLPIKRSEIKQGISASKVMLVRPDW